MTDEARQQASRQINEMIRCLEEKLHVVESESLDLIRSGNLLAFRESTLMRRASDLSGEIAALWHIYDRLHREP